jgi:hypothetical protein
LDELQRTQVGHIGKAEKVMGVEGAAASEYKMCDKVCWRCRQGLGIASEIGARMADVLSKAIQTKSLVVLIVHEDFGEELPGM